MADNDQLVEKIAKLLEAERAYSKKMVREEIEAEAKKIKHENTLNFFTLGSRLGKMEDGLKDVEISNGRLEQGQNSLHEGQGKLETMLEAVLAGQKELQETVATKAEVQDLRSDFGKYQKKNEQRLENLEEHTGTHNPHKN